MYGSKKEQIVPLLKQGISYSKIVEMVGCSKGTVAYHAKNLELPKKSLVGVEGISDSQWFEVQKFYNAGNNGVQCRKQFGISKTTWTKAVRQGKINVIKQRKPLKDVLVKGSYFNRGSLKRRLISCGLLDYRCYTADCPLNYENPMWLGKPATLFLDHINGVNNDNRLENLRILCANCHTETETYAGRNKTNPDRQPKNGYSRRIDHEEDLSFLAKGD